MIAETAGAGLLNLLLQRFNKRGLSNTRMNPDRRAAKRSMERMYDGYEAVAKDQGVSRPAVVELDETIPPSDLSTADDLMPYASNGRSADSGNYKVNINPEADEAYLAHELGHIVSRQTPIGERVRNMRDNPMTKNALMGALMLAPGAASALEAGDDDMDTSIALALAASAPTLVDEAAASINAYGIMNKAGARGMDGRQARRLAGGYLSYLAAPILAATAGNLVGNQFD